MKTSDYENIIVEIRDHILIVTLNRPDCLNAIDTATKRELADVFAEYAVEGALRAAVLTGSDCGSFSTGSDIREKARRLDGVADETPVPTYCETVASCVKPVIAAIDGYCVGGGLELALACDIRVATAASKFGLPEPRIGRLGNHGLDALVRAVPVGEAMLLHLTGGRIPAERAYQVGLIQALAQTREEMLEEALRIAGEIALCSPMAVRAIKQIVLRGRNLPTEYSNLLGDLHREIAHASADAVEGIRAFQERRVPVWSDEGRGPTAL